MKIQTPKNLNKYKMFGLEEAADEIQAERPTSPNYGLLGDIS